MVMMRTWGDYIKMRIMKYHEDEDDVIGAKKVVE